ncbi:hypothetical protein [Aromatoleum evansii]|uniref:hypothetical protein n=1 Tax=Aromatoleum evansii TaxID=59406 RepID=UPI00145C820C|nr:hypothetical protein [Aromatoleum evansii]NMG30626.1 hypothetical protein [Aromatoleum evansii]
MAQDFGQTAVTPVLVGGFIWRDVWASPFEGPLTRLWKLLVLNASGPAYVSRILFGRNLVGSAAAKTHGRSLLLTQWMAPEGKLTNALADSIYRAGLGTFSSQWANAIASDHQIRFCNSCLSAGYQSIFCQIDALLQCPVHGDPIIDYCMRCGAPTPRYALTAETMAMPFCCPRCGGGLSLPTAATASLSCYERSRQEFGDKEVSQYGIIADWLRRLDETEIYWPSAAEWRPGSDAEPPDKARRAAVFSVLSNIVPFKCGAGDTAIPQLRVATVRHDKSSVTVSAPRSRKRENAERIAVYSAICKSVRRVLQKYHRRCLKQAEAILHVEWGNDILWPSSSVCPFAFGFQLWRHHFEERRQYGKTGRTGKLRLRKRVLAWPGDRGIDSAMWGEFVLMSLLANLQVAIEWCERASSLPADYGRPLTPDVLEMIQDFRAELSPQFRAWSPRVTYFEFSRHGEDGLWWAGIAGPQVRVAGDRSASPLCIGNEYGETRERAHRTA